MNEIDPHGPKFVFTLCVCVCAYTYTYVSKFDLSTYLLQLLFHGSFLLVLLCNTTTTTTNNGIFLIECRPAIFLKKYNFFL